MKKDFLFIFNNLFATIKTITTFTPTKTEKMKHEIEAIIIDGQTIRVETSGEWGTASIQLKASFVRKYTKDNRLNFIGAEQDIELDLDTYVQENLKEIVEFMLEFEA